LFTLPRVFPRYAVERGLVGVRLESHYCWPARSVCAA
jgi:hypothetical protein